jgi:hypothetical protein
MPEYDKYSTKPKWLDIVKNVKTFHNMTKKYYIQNFATLSNLLIDIGSGRGSDLRFWIDYQIKKVIGIEPSSESIKLAINFYKKMRGQYKDKGIPRVQYLNGLGNLDWDDGKAAIRPEDRKRFIQIFGINKTKADNINMHWTIHYMMDTKKDFETLLHNCVKHTHSNSLITVLCLDGEMIHEKLKEGKGVYEIFANNGELAYKLEAKYPHDEQKFNKYGSKITVTFAGIFGLGQGIVENLVSVPNLIRKFEKNGFELIHHKNYMELDIPEKKMLRDYEIKISELHIGLVFKKTN